MKELIEKLKLLIAEYDVQEEEEKNEDIKAEEVETVKQAEDVIPPSINIDDEVRKALEILKQKGIM